MLFKTALFLAMPFASMASSDDSELKLKARFTGISGPIDGKVTIKQKGDTKTKGKWKVVFDHVDIGAIEAISGCAGFDDFGGKLNWHVHDGPANQGESNCGADVTGGHYDPTYGCGGASQYKGTVCEYLKNNTRTDYVYACSQESQGKCEIGDQSGKMGKVNAKTTDRQTFSDDWIGDVADLENKALVFHCCTPSSCATRVACATLEVTNEDD